MPLSEINSISEISALENTDLEYLNNLSSIILKNQLENISNINNNILLNT